MRLDRVATTAGKMKVCTFLYVLATDGQLGGACADCCK